MLPDLEFKRSKIYEKTLLRLIKKEPMARLERPILLETFEKLESRKSELNRILSEITNILHIQWNRKSIRIYALSFREHGTTFSDPLTISLCTSSGKPAEMEDVVDLISHELIHNAIEEIPDYPPILEKLKQDFPSLPEDAYSHIIVHAVHFLVYKKLRSLTRYEADKEKAKTRSDLSAAWNIVDKTGAEKILSKYIQIGKQ